VSRFHRPFGPDNTFAAQFAEILENRAQYRLSRHPVFGHINDLTADWFIRFCLEEDAWRRFLHDKAKGPILGPNDGFFRSAAYQCSSYLPTPRAIRRLAESVYAATYCDREGADGRYGGTELIELPFRYQTSEDRVVAEETVIKVERIPTGVAATITLHPGIAEALAKTRESDAFCIVRQIMIDFEQNPDSPLLEEARFNLAWASLCAVFAEHSAHISTPSDLGDHVITRHLVFIYLMVRVLGFVVLPAESTSPNLEPLEDFAAIWAVEKYGPELSRGIRAGIKIPTIRDQLRSSLESRASRVPLSIVRSDITR